MARKLRIDEPGLSYHVWINGVAGLPIFRDVDDKNRMVDLLREEVRFSEWRCFEYAVMTTHYHAFIRLRKPTLSSGFQRLNVRYARYFNDKYNKRGHVFDARFHSKIAEGRFAQLETIRYVALNPVKANICEVADQYPWCGYGAAIGRYADDDVVDVRALIALFGSRAAYRRYVEEPDERVRWGQARARPRVTELSAKGTRARAR
ncbi:MAG TPA: transposase [Gaiellaceae bacterium]|nr:transposase [Gaiellaceae bacterium]